jgi:hypothetical protein
MESTLVAVGSYDSICRRRVEPRNSRHALLPTRADISTSSLRFCDAGISPEFSRAERAAFYLICKANDEDHAAEASRCNELIYRPSWERRTARCALSSTCAAIRLSGFAFAERHIARHHPPRQAIAGI